MGASSLLVGVDLVRVSEVSRSVARFGDRYVKRLFTDHEIAYCRSHPAAAAQRFAARFAAKEAAIKVLRPEDVRPELRFIEVRRAESGHCDLVLHGTAKTMAKARGIASLAVSLSHEEDLATAVVVAQVEATKRTRKSRARAGRDESSGRKS